MYDQIDTIIARLRERPAPLLPILHAIQNELGYLPPNTVPVVAEALNLSRAEVHGVISFYHYFRTKAPGRHTVQVCRAEACQSMQGDALAVHLKKRLGVDFHETTTDGMFSLEPVYCLGNCACAPAIMIDGELHGRVTPARASELITESERRK